MAFCSLILIDMLYSALASDKSCMFLKVSGVNVEISDFFVKAVYPELIF